MTVHADDRARSVTRPPGESTRFVLRRETRQQHERLDAHPALSGLSDGSMGLERYRRLMTAFHGFYSWLEGPLKAACDDFSIDRLDFVYEARIPILTRDLSELGIETDGRQRFMPQASPEIASVQVLGGMLYVVEGSLLGGSVLYEGTRKLLGKTGSHGNSYWKWCRDAGGGRWAMTCSLLESLATDEARRSHMVDAARTCFQDFSNCLDVYADKAPQAGVAAC